MQISRLKMESSGSREAHEKAPRNEALPQNREAEEVSILQTAGEEEIDCGR